MKHNVHIKIADSGWILEKCAYEIARRSKRISFGLQEVPSADIQYYINYSSRISRVSPIECAFFTHSEQQEEARRRYFSTAEEVDACVCMSERYAKELSERGTPKVITIPPGVDLAIFRPKVRIGVVGRTYHTGRKGEAIVADVMDVPGIEWRFTGSGWPGPSIQVAEDAMPDFYNDLDYVLVPALYEGGPMSIIEGLACGIPIISSDVGWADKFPHIPFERGSSPSLRSVLTGLVKERETLRKSVTGTTWDNWAQRHIELFDDLASQISRHTKEKKPAREVNETIEIVSHGSERIAKGGPTSRIGNIVRRAAQRGVEIDVVTTLKREDTRARSLVHVFNSWPLQSAINELRAAKRSGAATVYSPIALNLQYHKYYSSAVPSLLHRCANDSQLREGMQAILQLTAPYNSSESKPPAEGVEGHFAALREGVSSADYVIFLSEYEKRFVESIGAIPKASTIVRNGVDTSVMKAGSPAAFQNLYGVSDFVLIVGRIESRKSQATVAYALKDIGRPVVCIGHQAEPGYFEMLKRWAGPNFIHIDRIEDREVLAGAYKAASCLVLASWAEGAPLVALEAAAAGTPMVLSAMSAEREYFGDAASYVHPADIDGIREATLLALEKGRDKRLRLSMSERFAEEFDIRGHTDETLSVYGKASASLRSAPEQDETPAIALDNTHLAHQLTRTSVLTGVTAVEFNVSRSILKVAPDINSYVWTGAARGHLKTSFADIEEVERSGAQFSLPVLSEGIAQVELSGVEVSVPPRRRSMSKKRMALSAVKQGLEALPGPLNRRAIAAIQKVRPNFEHTVQPEHRIVFRNVPGRVTVTPQFTTRRVGYDDGLKAGDRLILLGQPWISNDVMLDDLAAMVRQRHLSLWAHVPDIVYITDPESFDDQTRRAFRRRLEKLLRVTDTAIVISSQAEGELRQFIAACSLSVKTKRIKLSVSDQLLKAKPKQPSGQIPERFVMFVSSINNRKRHGFLIDVWRDVKRTLGPTYQDVSLILVGSPQNGYEYYGRPEMLGELAKDNIFLLRGTEAPQLAWLYEHCLFTVYPARSEGWGLPPIESLHFGKPCVVSTTIPSAIETDTNALIRLQYNDYFGWVNTIATLIAKEGVRLSLGKAAESYSLSSWDDVAAILLADE